MGLFTRSLGWSPAAVEVFLVELRKQLDDKSYHLLDHASVFPLLSVFNLCSPQFIDTLFTVESHNEVAEEVVHELYDSNEGEMLRKSRYLGNVDNSRSNYQKEISRVFSFVLIRAVGPSSRRISSVTGIFHMLLL